MILHALNKYYERLEADPEQEVAPFGFSRQKISFCIVLEGDGTLHTVQDERVDRSGKLVPKLVLVPGQSKPTGSGVNPCFLWDNAAYMLGFKPDDPKPERTIRSFEAFRRHHLALEETIDDDGFSAVCRFLDKWDPAQADSQTVLSQTGWGFGVFRLRREQGYLHEHSAVHQYWLQQLDQPTDAETGGISLVSGRNVPLARLHEPKIKGVLGAQSSGATLVSFNEDAFTSYGKTQGFNAPVGNLEAFSYCTALNEMLADNHRRIQLGDATVVFWSDRPTSFEDMFGVVLTEPGAEDERVTDRVRAFLQQLRQGRAGSAVEDADVGFYILGLAPNASRLAVRFWLVGTVGTFSQRLAQHVEDLAMTGEREGEPPLIIRRLLLETAREPKDIPPLLAGAIARAVLTGGPYPQTLFTAVLRRIHIERRINHRRAAILKAYLVRRSRLAGHRKEVPVSLDVDHPSEAYQFGRLFAAIEKTQEDALGQKLNRTVKDSYFSSASATPAAVFPRLLRLHQHHLARATQERGAGYRTYREKEIQEIVSRFTRFPNHLSLDEQGMFFIGYYHQRQSFFQKRDKDQPVTESGTAGEGDRS